MSPLPPNRTCGFPATGSPFRGSPACLVPISRDTIAGLACVGRFATPSTFLRPLAPRWTSPLASPTFALPEEITESFGLGSSANGDLRFWRPVVQTYPIKMAGADLVSVRPECFCVATHRGRTASRTAIPITDGRVLIMPRYTEPEPEQQMILEKLHLTLPSQPPPRIRAAQAEFPTPEIA